MKFQLAPYLFLIILIFLISSCVSNKGFERPFLKEQLLGKEPGEKVFVIKKDGERVTGNVITFSNFSIWKVKQKEYWVAIDGKKINLVDCESYQEPEAFLYQYDKTLFNDLIPNSPYRFMRRLRFGKINLYYYVHQGLDYGNDVRGDYHAYVFKKEKGKMELLDFDNFSAALGDNAPAIRQFRQSFPKNKIPRFSEKGNLTKLIEIVELYNK